MRQAPDDTAGSGFAEPIGGGAAHGCCWKKGNQGTKGLNIHVQPGHRDRFVFIFGRVALTICCNPAGERGGPPPLGAPHSRAFLQGVSRSPGQGRAALWGEHGGFAIHQPSSLSFLPKLLEQLGPQMSQVQLVCLKNNSRA